MEEQDQISLQVHFGVFRPNRASIWNQEEVLKQDDYKLDHFLMPLSLVLFLEAVGQVSHKSLEYVLLLNEQGLVTSQELQHGMQVSTLLMRPTVLLLVLSRALLLFVQVRVLCETNHEFGGLVSQSLVLVVDYDYLRKMSLDEFPLSKDEPHNGLE